MIHKSYFRVLRRQLDTKLLGFDLERFVCEFMSANVNIHLKILVSEVLQYLFQKREITSSGMIHVTSKLLLAPKMQNNASNFFFLRVL